MSYCKLKDVREMLKDDVINSLLGRNEYLEKAEKDALMEPIIAAAIVDSDAEIDGYLNKRYPSPLVCVPAMIEKLSKDIAIYNLMSRSGIDESEAESNYLTRYKAAIKYLLLVAEGKVDIGIPVNAASSPAGSSSFGFGFTSSKPIFGRSDMEGM